MVRLRELALAAQLFGEAPPPPPRLRSLTGKQQSVIREWLAFQDFTDLRAYRRYIDEIGETWIDVIRQAYGLA